MGTDFLFADLGGLRLRAQQSPHETKASFRLKDRDFVFAAHQGYEFLFFDAQESDDPAVWHCEEGDSAPQKVFSHFSEWLDACVSDEVEAYSAL
jgi:hypothetical protein